jgi:hypothetical protein
MSRDRAMFADQVTDASLSSCNGVGLLECALRLQLSLGTVKRGARCGGPGAAYHWGMKAAG